jgi:hypothetical protein
MMTSRKSIADSLKLAVSLYFVKKMYGVYHEVGVIRRGRRRADVLCVKMDGEVVICEVKSCHADFKADKKYEDYLDYCHKFYFVVSEQDWESWLSTYKFGRHIGVIVLRPDGKCHVVKNCTRREVDLTSLYYKLAWRGSTFSKRNTRWRRVYLC